MSESGTPERWLPVVGWEGLYEVSDLGGFRRLYREYLTITGIFVQLPQRRLRGTRRVQRRESKNYGTQVSAYWIARMKCGERMERRFLHVMVLEAFVGPRPEDNVARHLNDDTDDNRLVNLAWGTHSDNMLDLVRNGRHRGVAATHCVNGHSLSGPNLVARGRGRNCAACTKARAALRRADRRGEKVDFKAEADRWYEIILANPEAGRAKVSEDDVRAIRARAEQGEVQRVIALDFGVTQTQVSNIVQRRSWKHVA